MVSKCTRINGQFSSENYNTFVNGLKELYKTTVLPLELTYNFHHFHSPPLEDVDFEAKPVIMLVGQYSTGKTTLIKYLLKSEFPGIRIGPEPTTDKFISVMYGNSINTIPGNALVVDSSKPFRPLSKFGTAFLNKFQCSLVNCEVLKNISIIDTPGILSGEKQRVNRGYDFVGVLKWFAERVDRLLLLFDAHKLDISDEFRRCIEAVQGHDDKIRIILNKSDMVDQQQLMRVYGALMWSLGKIINTPEITKIHIGSFWDKPLQNSEFKNLFEVEQQDLLNDLIALPKNSAVRKLNDFIKRVRLVKVHAYIIGTLHKYMPIFFGKSNTKKRLISSLDEIYNEVNNTYHISIGDFPNINKMQELLEPYDFSNLYRINDRLINDVNKMLDVDVGRLMNLISEEVKQSNDHVSGGMFDSLKDESSPFGIFGNKGIHAGIGEDWIVNTSREKYDIIFNKLKGGNDKISGRIAKSEMIKSQLPSTVLGEIWKLADIDKDGFLDCDEFALTMYLIDLKLAGHEMPTYLPDHLVPPSKKIPKPKNEPLPTNQETNDVIFSK